MPVDKRKWTCFAAALAVVAMCAGAWPGVAQPQASPSTSTVSPASGTPIKPGAPNAASPGANGPAAGKAPNTNGDTQQADWKALRERCLHPEDYAIAKSGQSKLLVELANGTIWQPRDGRIRFTVRARDDASPSAIDKLQLRVCFGWPLKYCNGSGLCGIKAGTGQNVLVAQDRETYHLTYDLEPVDRDANSVTYETALPAALWRSRNPTPPDFADVVMDYYHRAVHQPSYVYDGLGLVPSVDMHLVGSSIGQTDPSVDPNLLDASVRVGLSFRFMAFVIALAAIAIVWRFLWICGRDRRVPGGWLLSIIANSDGYASLSQFQLVLWTTVIGAGAVYVISLSGTLISIPDQALALLGISGFSALLAAIKKTQDKKNPPAGAGPARPAEPTSPPVLAAVQSLRVLSTGANDVFLIWLPPAAGSPVETYRVTWTELTPLPQQSAQGMGQAVAAAPQTGNAEARDTFVQVAGLKPQTSYEFTVRAASGPTNVGPAAVVQTETAAQAANRPPPKIGELRAALVYSDNAIDLNWLADNDPDHYVIQYSRAGQSAWETWPETIDAGAFRTFVGGRCRIARLAARTPYQFRLFGVRDGIQGAFSSAIAITTGQRTPRWSDLVVWDGVGEIEITRVQMLVFTAIAAAFVAIKIIDQSVIPELPNSIVLLMGLTNGVYVGGKYTGASK
ncbi:MAG TPA: fibronectin type III domain-containing protein [Rhizomicrobium sp.]|nr:fibronectin type III domain-containing protein [Rhizomicrobium sp.]